MDSLKKSLGLRAALLSLLIFAAIVGLWQIAAQPPAASGPACAAAPEARPASASPSPAPARRRVRRAPGSAGQER